MGLFFQSSGDIYHISNITSETSVNMLVIATKQNLQQV